MAVMVFSALAAPSPAPATDRDTARQWTEQCLLQKTTTPPFSFRMDGVPSGSLAGWKRSRRSRRLDSNRAEHAIRYRDPNSGLIVRCRAIEYRDYPTVEWTVTLTNQSRADSPILSEIRAVDIDLLRNNRSEYILHHHTGSPCTPTDYRPFETSMPPGKELRIATSGGRPTDSDLPYFNLEWSGGGVILAFGWPGQWEARFLRDDSLGLRVSAGQEETSLRLLPGETIRTPLVVLQFHDGDPIRAMNVWRRWMRAQVLPKPSGKPIDPQIAACSSHQFGEMIHANEENQKLFIDRYLELGVPLEYWWMDAGWYPQERGWPQTGTWEVDPKRFPRGLRAISDHARARGVKSIVWFEPERVAPDTWLSRERPKWLLGSAAGDRILNLGLPDARKWLTNHVDRLIEEQGIDLYRNDFNIAPLPFWRESDSPGRRGMTEIRYVEGFLAYWDALRRRHPGMPIDTCASGGRRNDVETLRRSVPLLRSDFILDPTAQQNHTYGIAQWIPFHGTGVNSTDPYVFRSQICPHITCCYDVRQQSLDAAQLHRRMEEWRRIAPYFSGDFYPLTPYDPDNDAWMAWQYDRPEQGDGVVQAFRRPDAPDASIRLKLRGLDPTARYRLTDIDAPGREDEVSGLDLMEAGLEMNRLDRPAAAVLFYTKREDGSTPAKRSDGAAAAEYRNTRSSPMKTISAEVEEAVAACRPPDNGAGPLWCYGAPLLARHGSTVFASVMETGEGVPPLCNTRWRLFRRGRDGWRHAASADGFREREPCPLVVIGDDLFLSTNPSTQPPGTRYGECVPRLLRFNATRPDRTPQSVAPLWEGMPRFTDHSYRGIAADPANREILLLHIDAENGEQRWTVQDRGGGFPHHGSIRFPIRACYPQVALHSGVGHVLAIGDIVEPNEEWRAYKKEKTGAEWDYVFRRLFYALAPDLSRGGFLPPIEVDTVEATGGHIANLDLHVDDGGAAHLLYLKTTTTPLLRDRFFPDRKVVVTLERAVVEDGKITRRETLLTGGESVRETPMYARWHVTSKGRLLVVCAVRAVDPDGRIVTENRLLGMEPDEKMARLDLREPFTLFFTAAVRGGSRRSDILDLFGAAGDSSELRYARFRIPPSLR